MSIIRKYHNHTPQTKFIEKWRVKLEGEHSWIPAKLIDQKPFVLWANEWIHEPQLIDKKVSKKAFHSPLFQMWIKTHRCLVHMKDP